MSDRINLAELREELQAHENDDLYRITLGVPLVRTLIDAVEAAHQHFMRGSLAGEPTPTLRAALERFDFGEPS